MVSTPRAIPLTRNCTDATRLLPAVTFATTVCKVPAASVVPAAGLETTTAGAVPVPTETITGAEVALPPVELVAIAVSA